MPPNTADIPQDVVDRAKLLVRHRFSRAGEVFPQMKALARIALRRTARDMLRRPELYADAAPDAPAPEPSAALTPTDTPRDPLALLREDVKLPSLPQAFLELQDVIRDEHSSADDLAAVISKDPSLSAFLLRMVNSAFYSMPSQIDTISRAVTVVGVKQLSTLAAGTSILQLFQDTDTGPLDIEAFWKHSVACATIAREISRATAKGDPERCFVAGLLHDIGRLVLCRLEPGAAAEVFAAAAATGVTETEAEQALLGFDHARLGGMLLRKWNFPFVLVKAVLAHHEPYADGAPEEAAVVHCANVMAVALGSGFAGASFVPPSTPSAWDALGLDEDALDAITDGLHDKFQEAFALLLA
mgnify:CR=1 FL=1